MKSDFLLAITQLSAEKNLPKETVIKAVETALVSAYRKDSFAPNQNISVKINPTTGKVEVLADKTVVEVVSDSRREILIDEARRIKLDAQIGDIIELEATPRNAGRIAAQTAKQVILQRLHEAEHSAIFEEYADKESDIVVGLIQHIEPKQIILDLGRAEAILPVTEQVRTERYRPGQRLKVYLLEVSRTNKGPRVIVSRSHPNLLRRLFELEVPEVLHGTVEIKSVAREAGHRSKVAVAAKQEGIDPVGCCVGLRGIRIQNIVNELNGEKLDVVTWDSDTSVFISNALSPAQVLSVSLDKEAGIATVVVPDRQLSLAIGKDGQNARLAAKLTGWRIDIKNASTVEAEKVKFLTKPEEVREAKPVAELEEVREAEPVAELEEVKEAEPVAELEEVKEAEPIAELEEVREAEPIAELEEVREAEPVAELEEIKEAEYPPPVGAAIGRRPFEPREREDRGQIRFAEDIFINAPTKFSAKARGDRKKKRPDKEKEGDGIKVRKQRVKQEISSDEEEY